MSEPNVQREDDPPPQRGGDPESFEVAEEEDVMPALETLPGGDTDGTERDLNETFTARLREMEREYQERLDRAFHSNDQPRPTYLVDSHNFQ